MTPDLVRLSLRLLATPTAKDGQFYAPSKRADTCLAVLPAELRENVERLIADVRAIIPNDFAFSFFFTPRGADLTVEFEDGNCSGTAGGGLFTFRKSLLRKMRAVNWDERRAQAMKMGDMYDKLITDAQDRPVRIPSSKDAAIRHANELTAIFLKMEKAKDAFPFVMVFFREDAGFQVNDYGTRNAVIYSMADVMTTSCDILAVVENGTYWTFEQIEAAKLEAVEQLGPVSRAKAEGRYYVN